jgi:hypothetical protein
MGLRFTFVDSEGSTHLRSWAIPVIIAALCVPVVAAMSFQQVGAGLGVATGAAVGTALIVLAARARPRKRVEVAARTAAGHRVLVIAAAEATPGAAQRIADLAEEAADVRLVVPVPSHRLERWLSADDAAREEASRRLAHSAGALTAAGLPVSGSLGDSDAAQALEDELRAYPADEVIVLARPGEDDPIAELEDRLELPLSRVTP